jgi:hypothetical protein
MVTRVVAGIGDAGFLGGRPAGITDPGYKAGEKSPAAIPKASGSNSHPRAGGTGLLSNQILAARTQKRVASIISIFYETTSNWIGKEPVRRVKRGCQASA